MSPPDDRPERIHRVLMPVRPGRPSPGRLDEALEPMLVEGLGVGVIVTPFAVGTAAEVQGMAAFLQALAAWFPDRQILPRSVVADDPVSAIVAEAASHDLVVLGAPEGGPLVGSVSGRVVAEAGCPTMVIWRHLTRPGPQRILVPSDGTSRAGVAVDLAFALAEGGAASVTVLHVLDGPPSSTDTETDSYDRSLVVLEDAQSLRRSGVRLETMVVRSGDVAGAVRAAVAEGDVDLLLVGTHVDAGTGPPFGPVVVALLEDPPCPLALVHVPDAPT
jgi:nucleotide-binding universal stress UspA family protein